MSGFIRLINVNLFDGIFKETINFEKGFNIISGENGTGKTNLLKLLKGSIGSSSVVEVIDVEPKKPLQIQSISPKRNSERKNIEAVIQFYRQQNKNFDTFIHERSTAQINDNTFDNYPALGELFYITFEKLCREGGDQIEYMRKVTESFNGVIKTVFENYELITEWNHKTGTPIIKLRKEFSQDSQESQELQLTFLSCGEQEVLSLILNLFAAKDSIDVFLIDEPEVHLNWHLEEKLFSYLEKFSEAYGKQIIISTHSRVIFRENFLRRAQFLYWEGGKIKCCRKIAEEYRKKIAGEAIEIIKLGDFLRPTFFVEDERHRQVLEELASLLAKEITVSVAGNSSNVKSLYNLSKKDGGWANSYFLIDGDNQGNPYPGEQNFLHLKKYCIENYLVDFGVISDLTGKNEDDVKDAILKAMLQNKSKIFAKNKFFEFLVDRLERKDISPETIEKLDVSVIFGDLLEIISKERSIYIRDYMKKCNEMGILRQVLPESVVTIIEQSGSSGISC